LIALLGPSGSGKTTLLRIIAGLDFADSGNVKIDGADAGRIHARERRVGFVFQHYALFKHMTVFDNVAFGLRVRKRSERPSPTAIRERVMDLLKLVHLEQFADRYPSQLSGGQRQRVALARSLAVEPKLLLLDEPFGALDAKVRQELRRWLRRLHEEIQVTSIFVTHDQEEAMEVADRVVVMNQGKIEQVGTPAQVYHEPSNGFVYDFLGNYNEFIGWKDIGGEVHLAEDDLWEMPQQAASSQAESKGWLGSLVKKIAPALVPDELPVPARPVKISRTQMREKLSKRGIPVRIFARPHEMFVAKIPDDKQLYIPAEVIHINPSGPLAKLEMQRKNGSILQVEVPKPVIDELAIRKHDRVFVRPKSTRVFE
jgi:sulfate transport system ATP-binding protein